VTLAGAWQQLDRLRPEIQGLNIELEQKLMAVDYGNGSWDRYVDDYLALLRMAPEIAEMFAMQGLVASERCGRSEEVAEALRQLARFSRNPKIVRASESVSAHY
jgi:hypothetical protein